MKKLFIVFLLLNATDELNAQSSFYQGKTIRIIVGYLAGDNHDLWARAYGRFMGRHIPGNPDFVVQNMPGAGSMIAANYVYNLTKPDGLTLGAIGGALYYAQLTGRGEASLIGRNLPGLGPPTVMALWFSCVLMLLTRRSKIFAMLKKVRNVPQ